MKRFVSYLYSVFNNQKIHNSGFARIELRTGRNRVEIHLKENGYSGKTGTVYLFIKKEKNIQGISIGNITFRNNQADFRYEQTEENIGQTPWQIMQMNGILIVIDDRPAFLSQWDEEPVDTSKFIVWRGGNRNESVKAGTKQGEAGEETGRRTGEGKKEQSEQEQRKEEHKNIYENEDKLIQNSNSQQSSNGKQSGISRQSDISRQNGIGRQSDISRQNGIGRQSSISRQGGISRQSDISKESSNSNQSGTSNQSENSSQRESNKQNKNNRQRENNKQIENNRQKETSNQSRSSNQSGTSNQSRSSNQNENYMQSDNGKEAGSRKSSNSRQSGSSNQSENYMQSDNGKQAGNGKQSSNSRQNGNSNQAENSRQSSNNGQVSYDKQNNKYEQAEDMDRKTGGITRDKTLKRESAVFAGVHPSESMEGYKDEQSVYEQAEVSQQTSDIRTAELQPQLKNTWEQTWRDMLRIYPVLNQFEDRQKVLCVRIEIKDVRMLPEKYWSMINNSFLLHGFFNYRYLAFGKMDKNWFIGVPGIYQKQEHVMASIFGFPDFLPQKQSSERGEQPGYWYRILES